MYDFMVAIYHARHGQRRPIHQSNGKRAESTHTPLGDTFNLAAGMYGVHLPMASTLKRSMSPFAKEVSNSRIKGKQRRFIQITSSRDTGQWLKR